MWNMIQIKIIKAAYRLKSNPIASLNLLILSTVFVTASIIFILNLQSLQMATSDDVIMRYYDWARRGFFLGFLNTNQSQFEQMICIGILGLIQGAFLFLVFKEEVSQIEENVLMYLSFIKKTFDLQMIVIPIYVLKVPFSSQNITFKILAILFIFLFGLTSFFVHYFSFTCLFKNKNVSDQCYNRFHSPVRFIVKAIAVYTNLRMLSKEETVGLIIVIIVLHVVLLGEIMRGMVSRFNFELQWVENAGYIFIVSYFVVVLLKQIVSLVDDNKWIVLGSAFVWGSFAFYNFLQFFKNKLLIKQPSGIKNQTDAISYIRLLYRIYESRQQHGNSVMILGLVKDHSVECVDPDCVCKMILKSDSTDKFKDDKFLLKYVQLTVEEIHKKFDNILIGINVLAFKVEIMKKYAIYFHLSSSFLTKGKKDKLSLFQKFSLFQIYNEAKHELVKQHNENKLSVNIQLFKQEKKNQQCFEKIENFLSCLASFYRHNSRILCGLNFLQKQLQPISKILFEIQFLLVEKDGEETMSTQFIFLMVFFYRCVVNHTFKTKKLLGKLEMIRSRLQLKQIKLECFQTNLYSQNGCVILSSIDKLTLGKVSQVSLQTSKIFKYPTNQSMIGLDANKLLPKCFRSEHIKLMRKFVDCGNCQSIDKLKQSFCCDYEQNIFESLIFAQVALIKQQVFICVGIVKRDSKNHLIVNSKCQVDGCGTDLFRFLNQPNNTQIQQIFPKWKTISKEITSSLQIFRTQIVPKSAIETTKNLISSNPKSSKQSYYDCSVSIQKKWIGSESYYSVYKIDMKKKTRGMTINFLDERFPVDDEDDNDFVSQTVGDNDKQSRNSENVNENNRVQFVPGGSSTSSLADNQYSIWKIIEQITNRFKFKSSKNFPFLNHISILLIFLFLIVTGVQFLQVFIYSRGLRSVGQVLFADCAVSDNTQLLEILFNKVIMLQQYCGDYYDSYKCSISREQARNVERVLRGYITNDVVDLMKNQTFYGNKYFSYLLGETVFEINKNKYQIDTLQFMEFYVYSAKQANNLIQKKGKFDAESFQILLNLSKNWEELKKVTMDNINIYQDTAIRELHKTIELVIILSVMSGIFATFYLLSLRVFYEKKKDFISNIVKLYRIISIKTSQNLLQYFSQLEKIVQAKNMSLISKVDAPKFEGICSSSLNAFKQYSIEQKKNVIRIVWMIQIALIFVLTYQMTRNKAYWQNTIIEMNQLMTSQNFAFENYFQTKAYFLVGGFNEPKLEFLNKIMSRMRKNQVQFVKNAMQTNFLFLSIGNKLGQIFSELLIEDICVLAIDFLTTWQKDQCSKEMSIRMKQSGIMAVMAYFQRLVFQSLYDLQEQNINYMEYFKTIDFQNMDSYLIFTLRMFQLTQARIIQGNNYTNQQDTKLLLLVASVHTGFVLATLGYWFLNRRHMLERMSLTYGYVLVFPVALIKQSKYIQQVVAKLI